MSDWIAARAWVIATTGPFNVAEIPGLDPSDRKQFVATHIRPHCTPIGRGRWLNIPRPELPPTPPPELTTTGRPRLDAGELPMVVKDAARAKIRAMPIGTEFTSVDVLPEDWHRSAYQLSTRCLPFWFECWGPLLKRVHQRPAPVKVWTRGPAPMVADPMALVGAWWAAHPERNILTPRDLEVEPRYRCGLERWLAETFEAKRADGRHAAGYTRNPRRW